MSEDRKFADDKQVQIIMNLLESKLVKLPSGYWRYEEGWNDKKVAAHVGGGVNVGHVKARRTRWFGRLEDQPPALAPRGAGLAAEVGYVRERLDAVERSLEQLETDTILDLLRRLEARVLTLEKAASPRPSQAPLLSSTALARRHPI